MAIDITTIPGLTTARYEATKEAAKKIILNKLVEPQWANYRSRGLSDLPNWIVYAAIMLLLIVAGASFWISAGKEIAATALVLEPIGAAYDHLSPLWSNVSVVAALALGEAGTILFMLAASVLGGEGASVSRNITIRPAAHFPAVCPCLCCHCYSRECHDHRHA